MGCLQSPCVVFPSTEGAERSPGAGCSSHQTLLGAAGPSPARGGQGAGGGGKQHEPCRQELRHMRSPNHRPTLGPRRRFNRKNKPDQYLGLLEDAAWSRTPTLKLTGWKLLQPGLRHPQGPSFTRHTRTKGSTQKQTMHLACLMPSFHPRHRECWYTPRRSASTGSGRRTIPIPPAPSLLSEGRESVRSMRSDRLTSRTSQIGARWGKVSHDRRPSVHTWCLTDIDVSFYQT